MPPKTRKLMFVDTGGDGRFGVILRQISGSEPILDEKEYNEVISSQEGFVVIESGKMAVSDMYTLDTEKARVELNMANGEYKVGVFYVESKKMRLDGYVVVVCKP